MIPSVTPMSGALLIQWRDFVEPEDLESYDIYYGTASPPETHWTNTKAKETTISGLTPGTKYYARVFANDPFGPGEGSGIVEGTPL